MSAIAPAPAIAALLSCMGWDVAAVRENFTDNDWLAASIAAKAGNAVPDAGVRAEAIAVLSRLHRREDAEEIHSEVA